VVKDNTTFGSETIAIVIRRHVYPMLKGDAPDVQKVAFNPGVVPSIILVAFMPTKCFENQTRHGARIAGDAI
jgi:hypothetical protein